MHKCIALLYKSVQAKKKRSINLQHVFCLVKAHANYLMEYFRIKTSRALSNENPIGGKSSEGDSTIICCCFLVVACSSYIQSYEHAVLSLLGFVQIKTVTD